MQTEALLIKSTKEDTPRQAGEHVILSLLSLLSLTTLLAQIRA